VQNSAWQQFRNHLAPVYPSIPKPTPHAHNGEEDEGSLHGVGVVFAADYPQSRPHKVPVVTDLGHSSVRLSGAVLSPRQAG